MTPNLIKSGPSRRQLLKTGALCAAAAITRPLIASGQNVKVFDVANYGAVGDGNTLDSPAIPTRHRRSRSLRRQSSGPRSRRPEISHRHPRTQRRHRLPSRRRRPTPQSAPSASDYLGGLAGSASGDTMAAPPARVIVATRRTRPEDLRHRQPSRAAPASS